MQPAAEAYGWEEPPPPTICSCLPPVRLCPEVPIGTFEMSGGRVGEGGNGELISHPYLFLMYLKNSKSYMDCNFREFYMAPEGIRLKPAVGPGTK